MRETRRRPIVEWAYTLPTRTTTAAINLFTTNRADWIITPFFEAAANTVVKMDFAITDFVSASADASGMEGTDDAVQIMVSTDCGATWTSLFTFDASKILVEFSS